MNQSRREYSTQLRKFYNFSSFTGCLILLICLASLTLGAEDTETGERSSATKSMETQTTENTGQAAAPAGNTGVPVETNKEQITGTADRMERYDKEGITILIGNAKTVRYNEQGVEIGFLNADKITMKSDPETDTTREIIAEANVEIRDQDIFATCDHAIMNNLTNTITLKENVVVLQNKDRLETKLFTFNRTTGKQTGEGGVKFKVSVTQAVPVTTETDENPESGEVSTETDGNSKTGEETDDEKTPVASPEKTEAKTEESKKDTDTDADAEEKSDTDAEKAEDADSPADTNAEEKSDANTGNAEDADSQEETDTDTENPDDAEADPETDESEND